MNVEEYRKQQEEINQFIKTWPCLDCTFRQTKEGPTILENEKYDIIFADPDYSDEEAKQLHDWKLPKINYAKWTSECDKLLNDGGLLVVYHKLVVPNPDSEKYIVVKRVFIGNRVWHLPRVAIYFQRRIKKD
jgi:16S rRNA G966 N2-methylase RsmD